MSGRSGSYMIGVRYEEIDPIEVAKFNASLVQFGEGTSPFHILPEMKDGKLDRCNSRLFRQLFDGEWFEAVSGISSVMDKYEAHLRQQPKGERVH